MVINSAGPVNNKNQSKRWLLIKREILNPAESDVSVVTLFLSVLSFRSYAFLILISISSFFQTFRWRGEPACMRLAKPF